MQSDLQVRRKAKHQTKGPISSSRDSGAKKKSKYNSLLSQNPDVQKAAAKIRVRV